MKKSIEIKLESLDPTGVAINTDQFVMELVNSPNFANRLLLHVGECLYRIDEQGKIISRILPHERDE